MSVSNGIIYFFFGNHHKCEILVFQMKQNFVDFTIRETKFNSVTLLNKIKETIILLNLYSEPTT
ncbi:hypothetical protein BpHYR1_054316 [Brachionus plicatilis]|uniref:Uncharacterized protein n=1 Tax=Brachionus plicatilis TaxID=10195 RepID=A0A3M7QT68_BRAPC|nr:hypothetical protein BpHYR1_054316 [Brachionus plicatilis]